MSVTIALFGKSLSPDHQEYFRLLLGKLEESGCRLLIYEPFYELFKGKFPFFGQYELFRESAQLRGKASFLFSIGGDGTLLDSIQLIRDSGIPVAGINLGRMGFLSCIHRSEILPAIADILEGRFRIEKRSLISIESPAGIFGDINFALNELSINKKEAASMVVVQVWVDDKFLNSYWADGLIVATPTGSTAYSLSCNGPIITPDSHNFVITPIAPHNLTIRPIVIPDNSRIRIRLEGRESQTLLRMDSRSATIGKDTELILKKADFEVKLLQRINDNFFSTIRNKLNWGMDIRN